MPLALSFGWLLPRRHNPLNQRHLFHHLWSWHLLLWGLIDRSDTVGFHFGIRHYCSNKISPSPVISDPRVYICYGSKATTFVIAAILRLIHMFQKIPLVVCGLITSSLDKRDFLSRQNDSCLRVATHPAQQVHVSREIRRSILEHYLVRTAKR